MRRVVLFLTSFVLCLCIGVCCFLGYKYYSYNNISSMKNKIDTLEKKIDDTNKEITNKNDKIEKLKEQNQDKVNYLELWQKELKKVKRDS